LRGGGGFVIISGLIFIAGVRLAWGGMKPILKPQEEFRIEQAVNEQ
jgi:hypothetical protein